MRPWHACGTRVTAGDGSAGSGPRGATRGGRRGRAQLLQRVDKSGVALPDEVVKLVDGAAAVEALRLSLLMPAERLADLLEEGLLLAKFVEDWLVREKQDVLGKVVGRVRALELLLGLARVHALEDAQLAEILQRHLRTSRQRTVAHAVQSTCAHCPRPHACPRLAARLELRAGSTRRTWSLFTACVRVMYRPAEPVFFFALPIEFLFLNFFLR